MYYGISHEPWGECVYQQNNSDKCDIPLYTTRGCCITILYRAIENTVTNTITAVHDGKVGCNTVNIQRLSCILIGCIFYGMV